MGWIARFVVSVVVLSVLAGCGGDDDAEADTSGERGAAEPEAEAPPRTTPVVMAGPLVVWRPVDSVDESGALIRGELVVDGDCVHLSDGDGLLGVIWPIGTEWDAAESAVRLPDGTSLEHGDSLSGGGLLSDVDFSPAWTSTVDPTCTEGVTQVAQLNRYAPVQALDG